MDIHVRVAVSIQVPAEAARRGNAGRRDEFLAASRDSGSREQLEEPLKAIEYMEEQRRREGKPYIDVADMRRELGLPPR